MLNPEAPSLSDDLSELWSLAALAALVACFLLWRGSAPIPQPLQPPRSMPTEFERTARLALPVSLPSSKRRELAERMTIQRAQGGTIVRVPAGGGPAEFGYDERRGELRPQNAEARLMLDFRRGGR